jgi:hypothetical protein
VIGCVDKKSCPYIKKPKLNKTNEHEN